LRLKKENQEKNFNKMKINKEIELLVEKLANIEHQRWADWHKWIFKNWSSENVKRWNKQAEINYADLSEEDKQKDREQVYRYLPLLKASLKRNRLEVLEEVKELVAYSSFDMSGSNPKEKTCTVEEAFHQLIKALDEMKERGK